MICVPGVPTVYVRGRVSGTFVFHGGASHKARRARPATGHRDQTCPFALWCALPHRALSVRALSTASHRHFPILSIEVEPPD